ncbi:unnamed protein product [Staurois parvus]|uniref:Uncharacterized protein n=1 Tax=Staurois parvus TaxID=386267 RepID=A0ABN9GBH4_9NEOB|nr:unnamed protein product [Staurois parvus]
MTRDCGQHRDDQRLRTAQGRPETADKAGKTARRWIEEQVRSKNKEVRAGTCQIQVPAPHLPKGQQSSP